MKQEILKQIKFITRILVENSISVAQCYPVLINEDIVWQGYKNISFALRNQKYDDLYRECLKEKAFNFLLLDGAIVQMMYRFKRNLLIAHRLAFYPNPNIERYEDIPDEYEEKYYGNTLFVEMIDENIVAFPLRFDFDNDEDKFAECDHPYSHLTLGNYRNCRIPVSYPISPNRFMQFILRNFYFNKYKESFNDDSFKCSLKFDRKITKIESQLIHINFEI